MESTLSEEKQNWFDPEKIKQNLNWEIILFAIIILVAIITRFYDLGTRVMSHDESLHTFFSWELFKGKGFSHSPLMHGPLQFHLIAFAYFLFGDSDFSSRIPAALASIASVIFIWKFRRYLGKTGTLITAGLFVISPFMLYYGRYVRNEALVGLFGLVNLWAILRYLETGKSKYAYYLAAATAFHFTAKETSYIYLAQTLLFLGLVFLTEISNKNWKKTELKKVFFSILFIILLVIFALAAIGFGVNIYQQLLSPPNPDELAPPAQPELWQFPDGAIEEITSAQITVTVVSILVIFVIPLLIIGYGIDNLKTSRPMNLIVLFGTLVLPLLAAFPIQFLNRNPLDYVNQENLNFIAAVVTLLFLISAAIGIWWKAKEWLVINGIFYVIFIFFYTTFFTYGSGFFSGLVGSLGYWLEQQGVARGSQPAYYYFLIQIPLYEYLAALGTLLAAIFGIRYFKNTKNSLIPDQAEGEEEPNYISGEYLAVYLYGFWALSSLLAFTMAGEKMPWLTFHIALPMLLLSGWGLGKITDSIDWKSIRASRGWLPIPLTITLLISLVAIFLSISGPVKPFSGQTLKQLQITSNFLTSAIAFGLSLFGFVKVFTNWQKDQILSVLTLSAFAILAFMTSRTAFNAAYKNYDTATEYLVYAHSATGVKEVMGRIEDLSRQTAGELSVQVAFDSDVAWPFTWYLRNYENQVYFGDTPTVDLRNYPILIIGDNNFEALEPIVELEYEKLDYIRMWWPDQHYFGLNDEKIQTILSDPALRQAIFDIWWDRDFTQYGEYVSQDFGLDSWVPSDTMRLYLRKDMLSELWDYGGGVPIDELIVDPYEDKQITRQSDIILGFDENGNSYLNGPRDVAVAADGSIFVADSRNNRVVRFLDGEITQVYEYDQDQNALFNEPWGLALSPDGEHLFVADTWNHQVVKLNLDGEVITSWGVFDQTDDPHAFWGPRDIVIDNEGNLLVTNTGNKRIVVFTQEGEFLYQFGSVGFELGQFDEPVGLAIDPTTGSLYVADTWNQRIQVFEAQGNGVYTPSFSWDIIGWYSRTLDNKPFLNFGPDGNLYITDPDLSRILVFQPSGEFLHYFGDQGAVGGVGQPISVTSDNESGIWISDSLNNQLIHFPLP